LKRAAAVVICILIMPMVPLGGQVSAEGSRADGPGLIIKRGIKYDNKTMGVVVNCTGMADQLNLFYGIGNTLYMWNTDDDTTEEVVANETLFVKISDGKFEIMVSWQVEAYSDPIVPPPPPPPPPPDPKDNSLMAKLAMAFLIIAIIVTILVMLHLRRQRAIVMNKGQEGQERSQEEEREEEEMVLDEDIIFEELEMDEP